MDENEKRLEIETSQEAMDATRAMGIIILLVLLAGFACLGCTVVWLVWRSV